MNSNLLFPTTGGGTLFPPGCFSTEVLNQKVFMDLCPYADDVWFYAMRVLNDTPIKYVYAGKPGGNYMDLPSGDIDALVTGNVRESICRNDIQIKAVLDKYNLYDKLGKCCMVSSAQ